MILIDCDGVILDYVGCFHCYMESLGYKSNKNSGWLESQYDLDQSVVRKHIREFNQSDYIKNLIPIDGAAYYMKELRKLNYEFVCITSISLDKSVQEKRLKNFEKIFGEEFFKDIIFLDTYKPKDEILKNYANTGYWWIEDSISNAVAGKSLGLRSILFGKQSNEVESCFTWKEIYWKIVQDEQLY